MPDRHGPLRTTVGRYVDAVNDAGIREGAVLVHGTTLPSTEWVSDALGFVNDGEVPISPERSSLLAPAGARS